MTTPTEERIEIRPGWSDTRWSSLLRDILAWAEHYNQPMRWQGRILRQEMRVTFDGPPPPDPRLGYMDIDTKVTMAQIRALRDLSICPRPTALHGDVYIRHTLAVSLKTRGWATMETSPMGRLMTTITPTGLAVLARWREAVL